MEGARPGPGAPASDLDGEPRPVDIPLAGADATASEFDIGAFEAQLGIVPAPPEGPCTWILY